LEFLQVKEYVEDPLNHVGMVKGRVAHEMLKSFTILAANASHYTMPMLVIHGDADKITSFQAPIPSLLAMDFVLACHLKEFAAVTLASCRPGHPCWAGLDSHMLA
jgi:alpha-beta hydrolase superfamily lysophospholipase